MKNTTTNKSNKHTENSWEKELDAVRQYLLSNDHPFPPDHIGIVAALNGIDIEMKRRFRDSKLQQKFKTSTTTIMNSTNSNNNNNNSSTTSMMEGDYYAIDAIPMDSAATTTTSSSVSRTTLSPPQITGTNMNRHVVDEDDDDVMMANTTSMTDDWQDVTEEDVRVTSATTTTTSTWNANEGTNGTTTTREDDTSKITKDVVHTLAEHNVVCTSPISALAVVLHIVLLQCHHLVCTGVPDDTTSAAGGFAPPIRDLPVGQLVPLHWEHHVTHTASTGKVQFRYRKIGYGTFVLTVAKDNSTEPAILITLMSSKNNDTEGKNPLCIIISDHINLLSWDTAKKSSPSTKISPVLHYKGLGTFLRTFMQYVDATNHFENHAPPQDHFASHYANAGAIKDIPTASTFQPTSSSIDNVFPMKSSPHPSFVPNVLTTNGHGSNQFQGGPLHGQFDGDLYPGGLSAVLPNNGMSGNLMGPNHPIFNAHNRDDVDIGYGGGSIDIGFPGMKPRFDPFGPPGGPTELHPPPTQVKFPGGTGNPNNDLAIPPPFGDRPLSKSSHDMFL